jgi:glutamyl-tRNA reductase
MRFQLIGVNHKTAPVEVRERLAIPESRLPDACKKLAEHPAVSEGMIVSTCNRVEFIANLKNGTGDLREFLCEYFGTDLAQVESHLYEFREDDAIRHIFRVASSLDSMVVGEPQILGQVKEAYATARAVGAVRAQLDQLLTRAFAVAKRVRFCSRGTRQEDFRQPERQERLPGGGGENERVSRAAPAGARSCFSFCGQPHLRPCDPPGTEV